MHLNQRNFWGQGGAGLMTVFVSLRSFLASILVFVVVNTHAKYAAAQSNRLFRAAVPVGVWEAGKLTQTRPFTSSHNVSSTDTVKEANLLKKKTSEGTTEPGKKSSLGLSLEYIKTVAELRCPFTWRYLLTDHPLADTMEKEYFVPASQSMG